MYRKIVEYFYTGNEEPVYLGEQKRYRCRFCGKEKERRHFKKIAHAVAECIGNEQIFTYYECDECNGRFGEKEEHEIGLLFTFYKANRSIRGKKGIAKLDGVSKIEYNDEKKTYREVIEDLEKSSYRYLHFASSENETVTYRKGREISINFQLVYRALLKFALSVIPENMVSDFETGYKILRGEESIRSYCICDAVFKEPIKRPSIALFQFDEKRNSVLPRFFASVDVFQYRYFINLDFQKTTNYIPPHILKREFKEETDAIYTWKYWDYSSVKERVFQQEELTGFLSEKADGK